jgi:hypothetical protein
VSLTKSDKYKEYLSVFGQEQKIDNKYSLYSHGSFMRGNSKTFGDSIQKENRELNYLNYSQDLSKYNITTSFSGERIYICGLKDQAVHMQTRLAMQPESIQSEPIYVDGLSSSESVEASDIGPSVAINKSDEVFVFYCLNGIPGTIYAKQFFNGNSFGPRHIGCVLSNISSQIQIKTINSACTEFGDICLVYYSEAEYGLRDIRMVQK